MRSLLESFGEDMASRKRETLHCDVLQLKANLGTQACINIYERVSFYGVLSLYGRDKMLAEHQELLKLVGVSGKIGVYISACLVSPCEKKLVLNIRVFCPGE